MKHYLSITNKRLEQKNRIIFGLLISVSMNIAVVIGIVIGFSLFSKSTGTLEVLKDVSDASVDTVKRKANRTEKDFSEKIRILSNNMKIGFQQISSDIDKIVKKFKNDLK